MHKILYLIGARGCGKSTVGRKVAEHLAWTFADTDDVIQAKAGCSVAEMVARDGWGGFRAAESAALQACTQEAQHCPLVLATGGGMVLAEENRLFMRKHGLVFFLYVPEDVLVKRLSYAPNAAQRPSLTGQSITAEIHTILQERLPIYTATAHEQVDASLSIAHVTEKIYTKALEYFLK